MAKSQYLTFCYVQAFASMALVYFNLLCQIPAVMAIPTSHPPSSAFTETITATSFTNLVLRTPAPTWMYAEPPPPGGRPGEFPHRNSQLAPLYSTEKSFFGTLRRASTLKCHTLTLGSKHWSLEPPKQPWETWKKKAVIPTPTLSFEITAAARSTDHEANFITYPLRSSHHGIPRSCRTTSLCGVIPAGPGSFGISWDLSVFLWASVEISCTLHPYVSAPLAMASNSTIPENQAWPLVEAPEFLEAEKHEDRFGSYPVSNFSTVAERWEDENGLFQVDSRESADGDTTTLVASLELKPEGEEGHINSIGKSNSSSNIRSRLSGSISRCNTKGLSAAG
ncbi:hypothetical protein L873DRAFT_1791999 [Choiromyces venosus 120613-1]|uniref:Uncharacterized protein n=1 Tax=Choiromyces venosus 120613-1 TaxID=1336337 RepID=A0A3N4JHN3_9PEZI|nr:hypothetical protein L873DRAFT_1791999 [Choiromyces venosus 120613-1]